MRKLLNTLYVLSDDVYLALDGMNVAMKRDGDVIDRRPLHILQDIVTFSYLGASPALMGYCAEHGIGLAFCKPNGRFLVRVSGPATGNILLRREQYRIADDPSRYVRIARNMVSAKIRNQRTALMRVRRNHGERVPVSDFDGAIEILGRFSAEALDCGDPDALRGIEGLAAKAYFGMFDSMILNGKPEFSFTDRSRRPPLDRVNAMLSFGYSVLANDCASALECFGLDAYAGFLHRDRPGRKSLALDLMEELRAPVVDRFVTTLVNNRQIGASDFDLMDSGAVLLSDGGRRKFISAWQEQKQDMIQHPYLGEKIQWGILPHIQAQLLSRHLRGDIDGYPAFLWR